MNITKYSKILNLILVGVLVIAVFVLFIKLRNVSVDFPAIKDRLSIFYFSISFIVIIAGCYYVLNNFLTDKYWSVLDENRKMLKREKKEEDKKDEGADAEKKEDFSEILKKIIPNDKEADTPEKFSEKLLMNISKEIEISIGIIYIKESSKSDQFNPVGTYAYYSDDKPKTFQLGETLPGQAAKDTRIINLAKIPDNYITVVSGLGQSSPTNLFILPIVHNNVTNSVIEMASFKEFDQRAESIFLELSKKISEKLNKFIK